MQSEVVAEAAPGTARHLANGWLNAALAYLAVAFIADSGMIRYGELRWNCGNVPLP